MDETANDIPAFDDVSLYFNASSRVMLVFRGHFCRFQFVVSFTAASLV